MKAAIILQRICLIIAILFALGILYMHSGTIKLKMAAVGAYFKSQPDDMGYERVPATIESASINLIIADTEEKRTKGLSGRAPLSSKQGMLFIFDQSDTHGIWMKDMLFPIDIIWLDQGMKVVDIVTDVSPLTFPEVFRPKENAAYVLEVKEGFVAEKDINIGSTLVIYK